MARFLLALLLIVAAPGFAAAQDVASNTDFAAGPGPGDLEPKPSPDPLPSPLPPVIYPPSTVIDLGVESSSATGVVLIWTAPSDGDSRDNTAYAYDFRYSTVAPESYASPEEWFEAATPLDGEPAPLPGMTPQSWEVIGLAASTTYYFAMRSADIFPNSSGVSNIASGTTAAPDPTPEPSPSPTPTVSASGDDGNDSACSGSASGLGAGIALLTIALISIVNRKSSIPSVITLGPGGDLTPGAFFHFAMKPPGDGVPEGSFRWTP